MTFAAPGFLVAALAVAAAAVALHLLVLRPPPASRLPTARFVPPAPSMVRRLETWPRDRALLALRVATILLAGLAFAGPALSARPTRGTRLIAVDSSGASRDSATRDRRASDVVIPFDASLSDALLGARRAVAQLRADSIELIIISPFATSSVDAATAAIRAQWPAAIRTVRVALSAPLPHHARIHWSLPVGLVDTVGAVIMGDVVAVAPFTRARTYRVPEGRIIARWVDGTPAAAERVSGNSCEREIAIGMPDTRDVEVLRTALTDRPCGDPRSSAPMSDSALRAFAGTGTTAAMFGRNQSGSGDRTLMTILLALACGLAIAEWIIRR